MAAQISCPQDLSTALEGQLTDPEEAPLAQAQGLFGVQGWGRGEGQPGPGVHVWLTLCRPWIQHCLEGYRTFRPRPFVGSVRILLFLNTDDMPTPWQGPGDAGSPGGLWPQSATVPGGDGGCWGRDAMLN